MAENQSGSNAASYPKQLFPTGWPQFLGAVMAMMPALALMWVPLADLLLASYSIGVSTSVLMGGLVVLSLTLSHPTFMLTRGKRWPRAFLKRYNILCLLGLILSGIVHFFRGNLVQLYVVLIGLFFALIAFKLYRSRSLDSFCEHYQILWDAHRKNLKTGSLPS